MAFVCNAMFGLFCLSASPGVTQIEIHRTPGVVGFYNDVEIKGAGWKAGFLNTDYPDSLPGELIQPLTPSWTKKLCSAGQCLQYVAFCRDQRAPHFCAFHFEVGFIGVDVNKKDIDFTVGITVYADGKKGLDAAIRSFAYVKPKPSGVVFPLADLKLDYNPPCPVERCPGTGSKKSSGN